MDARARAIERFHSRDSFAGQLADFSRKINTDISPVYTSRKIEDEVKVIRDDKLPLVSPQCVVLFISMWPERCRLCRLHVPTPTSTN